jgi:hypothetical protein
LLPFDLNFRPICLSRVDFDLAVRFDSLESSIGLDSIDDRAIELLMIGSISSKVGCNCFWVVLSSVLIESLFEVFTFDPFYLI